MVWVRSALLTVHTATVLFALINGKIVTLHAGPSGLRAVHFASD